VTARTLATTSARSFSGADAVYSYLRTATAWDNWDPNTNHATHDMAVKYPVVPGTTLDAVTLWRTDVSYTASSRYFWQLILELTDGTTTTSTLLTCRDWGGGEGCPGDYLDSHDQTATGTDGQPWYRHRVVVPAGLDQTRLTVTIRHVERSWDGSIAESGLYYDLLGFERL
jgi:hypothetical protein